MRPATLALVLIVAASLTLGSPCSADEITGTETNFSTYSEGGAACCNEIMQRSQGVHDGAVLMACEAKYPGQGVYEVPGSGHLCGSYCQPTPTMGGFNCKAAVCGECRLSQ